MVALKKLAKICAQNPASILFARLADGLLQQGDVAQALAVCRTGLRYRPSYVAGQVVMGKCYLAAGLCEEARLAFEKALQLDANHLVARWHLGHIALQQGRGDLALEHFESARDRDPFGPELREQIGKLKGEPSDEARAETSEAKALPDESDAPVPVPEAEASSQVSELPPLAEEGIEEHLDALIESRNPVPKPDASLIATATLAELYANQGLIQEAIAVLEQLLAHEPDNERVIARLDELRNLSE